MAAPALAIFDLLDGGPLRAPRRRLYAEHLELCVLADELGYAAYWVAEHHGPVGGVPHPAVLLAAAAARTASIGLGPACAILPLRRPRYVAEDYGMLADLAGERLRLGVGAGSVAAEFERLGVPFEGRRERFAAALGELREAFARDRGESPTLYVATSREPAARAAGRAGDGLLTLLPPRSDDCRPRLAALLGELAAGRRESTRGAGAGGAPRAVVMLMAHVAETEHEARRRTSDALARYAAARGWDEAPDALFDALVESGSAAFGTAEAVAGSLSDLARRGAEEVALWMSFGGMDQRAVADSMARVARDVAPVVGYWSGGPGRQS